jgi:hypothetical protein
VWLNEIKYVRILVRVRIYTFRVIKLNCLLDGSINEYWGKTNFATILAFHKDITGRLKKTSIKINLLSLLHLCFRNQTSNVHFLSEAMISLLEGTLIIFSVGTIV